MESDVLLRKYSTVSSQSCKNNKPLSVIKSHLMLKYNQQAKKQGLQIKSGSVYCQWCFNSWSSDSYKVILKPQKHPKLRIRSLLNKDFSSLNKYQQTLVAKIKKSPSDNALVLQCLVCSKNTPIHLRKQNVKRNSPDDEKKSVEGSKLDTKNNVINSGMVKTNKKKKKKDKFAGLSVKAVQSVKQPIVTEIYRKPKPANSVPKKPIKDISLHQQISIHRALVNAPKVTKKPSLLATFLDNM